MKKFFIVILTLLALVCIVFDVWYLTLCYFGEESVVGQTFIISEQEITYTDAVTGEETSESKYFCEIAIWDNCFEIKFNEVFDETNSSFVTSGIQFYYTYNDDRLSYYLLNNYSIVLSDTISYSLSYSIYTSLNYETIDYSESFLNKSHYTYYDTILYHKTYDFIDVTEYFSADDFETTTVAIKNLYSDNTFFKILIDGENYLISPKFADEDFLIKDGSEFKLLESQEYTGYKKNLLKEHYFYDVVTYYRVCDIYYIAEMLYASCSSLNYSSSAQVVTFNLGDYFNYYKYNGDGSYELINNDTLDDLNLISYVNNYYQIKVYKHEGNMTSSSQSLFNSIDGSPNYNSDVEDTSLTDYFVGRIIYNLDYSDFVLFYDIDSNVYYLYLNEKFIEAYNVYSASIRLNINIDLSNIAELNINEIYINTGPFVCYMLNDEVLDLALDNYILEVQQYVV